MATEVWADDKPPRSEANGFSPVVGKYDIPQVGRLETIQLSSPPDSGQLSPASPPDPGQLSPDSPDAPQTVAFEDMGDSSAPLSPNRVQAGKSQDVPDDGSLFHVCMYVATDRITRIQISLSLPWIFPT